MKTTYLILMVLFSGQVLANPNNERSNPLNLTEEQQQQMQAVKQATHERMQAAREEIMADSKAQMAKFLTAEQMAQMESLQAHRKQHTQLRKNHKKKKRRHFNDEQSDG